MAGSGSGRWLISSNTMRHPQVETADNRQGQYMRRQAQPFIVEIKRKRGTQKSRGSIWGDIDLSTIAVETRAEAHQLGAPVQRAVDSDTAVPDVEALDELPAEHTMADPQEAASPPIAAEAPAKSSAAEANKKVSRPRKAKAETKQAPPQNGAKSAVKASEAQAPVPQARRKIHSAKERTQKLSQIEKSVSGGATLKSAVGDAGISEQTYYQWKKAVAPAVETDELKDLLALEDENKRLKKMLADQLRKENAELKKRLGLK